MDCCRKSSYTPNVRLFTSFGLIAVLLGLFGTVYIIDKLLPTPLTIEDELAYPWAFITERAQRDLKILNDFGPKVAGSYASEILTVGFFESSINDIIDKANAKIRLQMDVQTSTGDSYDYTNIVVKVFAKKKVAHSVLINSHFDSVSLGPGASDDGINCAVMLEVLRKISQDNKPPANNLIFLFNGAEEIGLVGARNFVRKHKWANESKVFVNLEATGNGGKIILFQVTPGATWLLDYYSQVPHPHAQIAGEELYQSGVLMSGTDYTIFTILRDMVGVDMAFFKNAERYHTKYDTYENIPPGSFQHVGDNLLSLVRSLANAPEVASAKNGSHHFIYFDFLGLFLITYSETANIVINTCASLLSIAVFVLHLLSFKLKWTKQCVKYMVVSFFALLGGWVLASLCIAVVAITISKIGYSTAWHSNPWIFLGLYTAPTAACSLLLLPIMRYDMCVNIKCQIQAHYVRIVWTLLLILGTVFQVKSIYILAIAVLFNSIGFLLIYIFKYQHSVIQWQIIYIFTLIVPTIFLMYAALLLLSIVIPVSARFDQSKGSLIVGLMSMFFTILITSPFVPLTNLIKDFKFLHLFFGIVFVAHFIIVLTPLFKLFNNYE